MDCYWTDYSQGKGKGATDEGEGLKQGAHLPDVGYLARRWIDH